MFFVTVLLSSKRLMFLLDFFVPRSSLHPYNELVDLKAQILLWLLLVDSEYRRSLSVIEMKFTQKSDVVQTSPAESSGLKCLTYSPDGLYLAGGSKSVLTIWDVDTGNEWATVQGGSLVTTMTWFEDILYAGFDDGNMLTVTLRRDDVCDVTGFEVFRNCQEITVISLDNLGLKMAVAGTDDVQIWKRSGPNCTCI